LTQSELTSKLIVFLMYIHGKFKLKLLPGLFHNIKYNIHFDLMIQIYFLYANEIIFKMIYKVMIVLISSKRN